MGLYFLLVAGAGADDPSAIGGALTFHVDALQWWTYWTFGSAII